ncbi:element excision factor XisH family protein [Nostoc piscinale]|uniref:element excision factor XisH family protein n=1 Tax=Nostoc piscinale TaxID=224012 RepID=UPI000B06B9DD
MAAKDIFHDAVKKGLEKEGWIITNDPLKSEFIKLFFSYRLSKQLFNVINLN